MGVGKVKTKKKSESGVYSPKASMQVMTVYYNTLLQYPKKLNKKTKTPSRPEKSGKRSRGKEETILPFISFSQNGNSCKV